MDTGLDHQKISGYGRSVLRPDSDPDQGNLTRRWALKFSLLLQKFLHFSKQNFRSFGSSLENWLNLVSCNRNIFVLFINYLRGNVVKPVRGSETFLSIVGLMDGRVHLDEDMKSRPKCRYYSAFSIMAAKISYENENYIKNIITNQWKMELLLCKNFRNDTQAFMVHDKSVDPDIIVVAFRGTEPFNADDWSTDIDFLLDNEAKVHQGFLHALLGYSSLKRGSQNDKRPIAYNEIRKKLREIINQNERTKFIVTGHSLGGALAVLFPAVLARDGEESLLKRLEGIYTFGQPRVGSEDFVMFMKQQMKKYGFKYLRFVYSNDLVPRLPRDDSTFSFKHFGTCLYYNSCYRGQIMEEEPDKNFKLISTTNIISRSIVAIWELIRSFIVPYTEGPEYAEGWFLRLLRLFGIIFPGFLAHNPQDYVNITRLGSDTIYSQLEDSNYVAEIPLI